jgi:hypothetical protein
MGHQVNDNKAHTKKKAGIVNKVFKTADEMFAIRFWRKNAIGTEVSKFESHVKFMI